MPSLHTRSGRSTHSLELGRAAEQQPRGGLACSATATGLHLEIYDMGTPALSPRPQRWPRSKYEENEEQPIASQEKKKYESITVPAMKDPQEKLEEELCPNSFPGRLAFDVSPSFDKM